MSDEDLKPCPQCGAPGEIHTYDDWETHYWAECSKCSFTIGSERCYYRERSTAVGLWNTHEDRHDVERFAAMAGQVRTVAETLLTEFFGDRCQEFDAGCVNCTRWRLLDELIANPFNPG